MINRPPIDQSEMLARFTLDCKHRFNQDLLSRDSNEIITELMNVIYSCERDRFFTIKVKSWKVLTNPIEVNARLNEHETERLKKTKQKNDDNKFEYIQIKESDINLLVIEYLIGIKEEYETIEVLICVPRFVDKYYFRIQGNKYLPMYQLVDSSTYNNAYSNDKKKCATLKNQFQPLRIYRNMYNLKSVTGEDVPTVHYVARVFKKSVSALKFILAKYGLYETFNLTNIHCIEIYNYKPAELKDSHYIFEKINNFIAVPKYLYDNEPMIQSLTYTISKSINKKTLNMYSIFDPLFWKVSLGEDFNNASVEKGLKMEESIENIYDISTREKLRLPDEYKDNIYKVILWMCREINALISKDNLDVSIKRVRIGEYIAGLYASKLSSGIHRVSDHGMRADLDYLKRQITTLPNFLLSQITKCVLVNCNNAVNDLDAIYACKYSIKGTQGIGNTNSNNITDDQRRIHVSHIGILDLNSSGNSDPGSSGIICPLSKYTPDGYFTDFQEPNYWEEQYEGVLNDYKALVGMKECLEFESKFFDKKDQTQMNIINDSIKTMQGLIKPLAIADNDVVYYPLSVNQGGIIYGYDWDENDQF